MKIQRAKREHGFTMVEMIGVLMVIAILAAMLIPKIFETINNSKINATVEAYNTIKSATGDHYTKWGKFATTGGANVIGTTSASFFDTAVLLAEGWIDKGYYAKIGSQTQKPTVRVVGPDACGVSGAGYNLDGDALDTKEVKAASTADAVVEVIIYAVTAADALELSKRIDGVDMSAGDITATGGDKKGRVTYAEPGTDGETDVYIYVAHR